MKLIKAHGIVLIVISGILLLIGCDASRVDQGASATKGELGIVQQRLEAQGLVLQQVVTYLNLLEQKGSIPKPDDLAKMSDKGHQVNGHNDTK